MARLILVCFLTLSLSVIAFLITVEPASGQASRGIDAESQLKMQQLVEANIVAVHAFQISLAKKTSRGDANCFSGSALSDHQLETLVNHQSSLLSFDPKEVAAWARGQSSSFDPSKDLLLILSAKLQIPRSAPVSTFTEYLRKEVKGTEVGIRAVANLYQTVLEVERDGDVLQQEFDLYVVLGLPVYLGQMGLPGGDSDFLVSGKELADHTCASPFDTDAAAWQIAGRKIWNWGEKKLHIRDEKVLAAELLREPEIKQLTPRIQAMKPQKIAIIGHSFTMGAHWSSPSSFVPIVAAMFAGINARVEFRQFQAGGLTASRALKNFYSDALAWKPDKVLLVVLARQDEDYDALRQMGEGFAKSSVQCVIFDNLHDPEAQDPAKSARFNQVAHAASMTIIQVDSILRSAPEREQFVCLDRIHMTEPYHRLMAKEWLKFLVGAKEIAVKKPN